MQQTLVNFFARVLKLDDSLIKRISTFDGDVRFEHSNGVLLFTLSGLHQFLYDELDLDYPEFQKMIYQSNLNEELFTLGGGVKVHRSTGKVDSSWYKLVKISED